MKQWWLIFLLCSGTHAAAQMVSSHATSIFGDIKYPADFKKFDYAPKPAPAQGVLRIAHLGSFDNLNPFNTKGSAAPGLSMLFSTLMTPSADESNTNYGWLAQSVRYTPDKTLVEFDLRPNSQLQDGTPITADDVVFTFNLLREKGSPSYKAYYASVDRAEAVSPRTVRFYAKVPNNRELPLILGQMTVLSRQKWQNIDFDKALREVPVGSGAYRLAEMIGNRTVVYQRVDKAPLQGTATQYGRHQLREIRYEGYLDPTTAFEAFKKGDIDVWVENSAKNWAQKYDFATIHEGKIIKTVLPAKGPFGMQAFVFNMRRPVFADRVLRQAISTSLDFEALNRTLFYGQYTRTRSFFQSSELEATGLPSPDELALLEPWRKELPTEIFTQEYQPPTGEIRQRLLTAAQQLQQAGYTLDNTGKLRDVHQQPVQFAFLVADPSFERVVLPIIANLRRLGIDATMQVTDGAQYTKRVEAFDYDMIVDSFPQSSAPGNEQRDMWTTTAATTKGSQNTIGVKSPLIDSLVEKIIFAQTKAELVAASRALDRVLQWQYYVIPQWHFAGVRMAYNANFVFPDPATMPYGGALPDWWRMAKP